MRWLRERRERERQRIYNGHDMYISRERPNVTVELTCRRCGFATNNLDPMIDQPPYRPAPIKDPCPGDAPG